MKNMLIIIICIFSMKSYSQNNSISNSEKKLLNSFFNSMKNNEKLNDYIFENNSEKVNFILVDRIEIIGKENGFILVNIDNGLGEYCIQLKMQLIKKNSSLKIEGFKNKNNIINPWKGKRLICSKNRMKELYRNKMKND